MNILSEQQKIVLKMPFCTFLEKFLNERRISKVALLRAVSMLTGCKIEDAPWITMKELVSYSKQEWGKSRGVGGHALYALEDAFRCADLYFAMIVTDNDLKSTYSQDVNSIEDVSIAGFESLQQKAVSMGCGCAEIKILRPDGFTWVMRVLPPEHIDKH